MGRHHFIGARDIDRAAARLRDGGLVAFPTETVYGLGADAANDEAVARIFEIKGRPAFNPLIVHVADRQMAGAVAVFGPAAERLAEIFWPGPLTLVLPRREGTRPVSRLASAGLDTVALRQPDHRLAQALLAAADRPIAAPSANRSGGLSPTRAEHVDLPQPSDHPGGRSDDLLVIDGGPCPVGIESTVVEVHDGRIHILRPGGVPEDEIAARSGLEMTLGATSDGAAKSPGQGARHYAPATKLRLEASQVAADEVLLAFGPTPPKGAARTENLSAKGDLREAAANLFAMLHTLDGEGARAIAVMPVPDFGLGLAINDRLRRGAEIDQ
ncbi:MAG: L-threonylcarbamoyladenylate synthase [Alphaproteobacteria bacterium]|nr:L-threonylcarbamoyladenylate synthase [Alphaproteobacteria bacterium]